MPRQPVLATLSEPARQAILTLVAAHDLGKFSRAFRAMLQDGIPQPCRHWELSDRLLLDLDGLVAEHLGGDRFVRGILYAAVAGHHGGPPSRTQDKAKRRAVGREATEAACAFLDMLREQFPDASLESLGERDAERLSWPLSGLVTAADWVGSNATWFPFQRPDIAPADYWRDACHRAELAVAAAGLDTSRPRTGLDGTTLTGLADLRPMQRAVEEVALPDGPVLAMIEDATGAGKTEAALILAQRMMGAGKAGGIFFALPTMATSNAMFDRIRTDAQRMFDGNPSLTLAHGRSRHHQGFREIVGHASDEPDAPTCAPWLADDRRRALLAEIGVGTIDQALMAVLPTRFATLRQWGLSSRVLIVDEAHAYDPYMERELATLLRFQAMLGGSAIVMTATLPQRMRDGYVAAFQAGLGNASPAPGAATDYPVLSVVGSGGHTETRAVDPVPATHRSVAVRRVPSQEEAVSLLVEASTRGGACVWVRNAVDDAIAAVEALRTEGVSADLLHARFALCDRLAIETEMQRRFGRDATAEDRAGRVLVATQVVEASLDLDFDVMVSDLAPVGSLIQRAGRLWRHMDRRPAAGRPVPEPVLHVLSPDPDAVVDARWLHAVLDRGAFVYPQDVQWRTARALFDRGRIEAPAGLRPLIEAVEGAQAPPSPAALERVELDTEGRAAAERAQARRNLLDPAEGYLQEASARVFDDEVVPTRLGIPQVTLVLARPGDGVLRPWAEGDEARAWALSEVQMSKTRFDALAEKPDQTAPEAARVLEGWPEWKRASHRLAVVNDDGRIAQGLKYGAGKGLIFDG